METNETIEVSLSADERGNFTIAPTTCAVSPGDRIVWNAGGNPFAIHFLRRTPMDRVTLRPLEGAYAQDQIGMDAPSGVYEYAVAIYDQKSGRLHVHVSGEVEVRRRFP